MSPVPNLFLFTLKEFRITAEKSHFIAKNVCFIQKTKEKMLCINMPDERSVEEKYYLSLADLSPLSPPPAELLLWMV